MFLTSRVHLVNPGLTIFNIIDSESQSMAAALSAKSASDLQVRFFRAMLGAWGRSDVKVLLRTDEEMTLTLILREVQARRQQRTLVGRLPVESHATMGAMERANRTAAGDGSSPCLFWRNRVGSGTWNKTAAWQV